MVPAWIARADPMPARFTSHFKFEGLACRAGRCAPSTPLPTIIFMPLVAAAIVTAFSMIGIMRYLPPVFLASLSSM